MRNSGRDAFTLIEVMIAVVIISVVIMALLTMKGNSTHIFMNFSKAMKTNQLSSFFIANKDYGFEGKSTTLDKLLGDFTVENNLRRELRKNKVKVVYTKLSTIDLSESDEEGSTSNVIFEVGRSTLQTKTASTSLIRLRLQ